METFRKEERLNSKALIDQLFEKGTYITVSPFRTIWMDADFTSSLPAQIAISVSKKRFKHAVDRNRVKRLVREAYRRNKYILLDALTNSQKKCILLFIYTGKSATSYSEVESKIILTLQRLSKEFGQSTGAGKVSGNS